MIKDSSSSQLSGVPRTLLLTLRARADEQARSTPLFADPQALEWSRSLPWDEELESIYTHSPIGPLTWAIRTYCHDYTTSRFLTNHPQAVVVELGGGLSSRYHRLRSNVYRWFELDLPVVTDLRRQLEDETEQYQFLSYSVLDYRWMQVLPEVPPENILFIAEGLFMYFEAREVQQLLDQMRSRFPGATLSIEVLGKFVERMQGVKKLDPLEAPLKWYVNDEKEVAAMGLSPINVFSLPQTYPERWPWLFRWFSWLSPIRNSCLVIETKLEPWEK